MDEKALQKIITNSIRIGCIETLAQLGLLDEHVTEPQAHKMYGKNNVKEWRSKKWIVGYPTGNSTRSKFHFKRSELEFASRMMDINNVIPPSVFDRKNNQKEHDDSMLKEIKKRQ